MPKIEEERKMDCQYWLGYLSQKARGVPVPEDCIECEKVLECLLERYNNPADPVAEISACASTPDSNNRIPIDIALETFLKYSPPRLNTKL
jgi:hypothetical protein